MSYKDKLFSNIFSGNLGPLKPGGVTIMHIRHEDGCAFFKGGECDCDPEIVAETVDPGEEDGCPNDPP